MWEILVAYFREAAEDPDACLSLGFLFGFIACLGLVAMLLAAGVLRYEF